MWGVDAGTGVIVMELIDGKTIADVCATRTYTAHPDTTRL
jgi:hypothetical protein